MVLCGAYVLLGPVAINNGLRVVHLGGVGGLRVVLERWFQKLPSGYI